MPRNPKQHYSGKHRKQQTSKKQKVRNEKEYDVEENPDFVIGRIPAIEVLKSERDINKIFLQEGLTGSKLTEINRLAKERRLQVSYVPKAKLDQLTDNSNHQGVVIGTAAYQYAEIDDLFAAAEKKGEDPFFLLLDGVEDPHNLGSIMRTADASGAHGIIITKRRAVGLTATVAKASTGAIEHVPVVRVTNLVQTIKELKNRGIWFYGTDMKGQDYRKWDTKLPIGLVIGNEGQGVGEDFLSKDIKKIHIPMKNSVESLNANVAASIMMFESYRRSIEK